MVVSETVFECAVSHRRELLFDMDKQRGDLFRSVKTSPIIGEITPHVRIAIVKFHCYLLTEVPFAAISRYYFACEPVEFSKSPIISFTFVIWESEANSHYKGRDESVTISNILLLLFLAYPPYPLVHHR